MELTNNAKATIAFSGALAVLAVYDHTTRKLNHAPTSFDSNLVDFHHSNVDP